MTVEDYREHTKTYKNEAKRRETNRILDYAQTILEEE